MSAIPKDPATGVTVQSPRGGALPAGATLVDTTGRIQVNDVNPALTAVDTANRAIDATLASLKTRDVNTYADYNLNTKADFAQRDLTYQPNGAGAPVTGLYSAINKADGDYQLGMLGQRSWGSLTPRPNTAGTDQATDAAGNLLWNLRPSGWNQYNGLTYVRATNGVVSHLYPGDGTFDATTRGPAMYIPGDHANNQFAFGQPLVESLMTEGSFVKDITSVSDMIKKWNYVMFRAKNGNGYGQYMPDDRTTIGVVFFWIGFGVLSGLGLIFLFLTLRRDETKRRFHYITVCYSWIAAVAYYCMARGQGSVALFDTLATNSNYSPFRVFYFARYIDWTFSTPLILLDLALLAGTSIATAAMLCFADVMMIVTGLLGALSMSGTKWGWFAFSSVGFIAILISLVTTLRKAAREKSPEVEKTYNILVLLVFLTWPIYPIIWIIGQGTKSIHIDAEIIVFSVTDCCAKGLFGLVLLLSTNAIEDATFKDSKKMSLPPTYTSSTIYQGVLESKA
eukprot:tig00001206_g7510.t1